MIILAKEILFLLCYIVFLSAKLVYGKLMGIEEVTSPRGIRTPIGQELMIQSERLRKLLMSLRNGCVKLPHPRTWFVEAVILYTVCYLAICNGDGPAG